MSLELSTLTFKVETEQLKLAKERLDAVAAAVKNLGAVKKTAEAANKSATKTEEQSTDAAVKNAEATKAQAEAEEALSKARKAAADAAKAEIQLTKAQTAGSASRVKGIKDETEATKQSVSVLERQTAITDLMAKGLSKGQASVVANMYAFEGLSQSVKDTITQMQIQRGLMGGDPFDKSQSGLISLKNAHRELSEAIKQYNRDTGLTKEQTRDLVRDKQRLVIAMGAEGKSFGELKTAMRELQRSYIEQSNSNNKLSAQEKEKARLQRESANAVRAVVNEEQRMLSIVDSLTNAEKQHLNVTEKQAIAYSNYARNLQRSGVTAEQAAVKLKAYSQQQKVVQDVEDQRQAKYLQRGLQPQIGDVAVSLAAGQNPLTVLLQQGDQIRGLIAQTGVSGELLRKTMANAMSETVKSIGQTAAAMGSVLGGAITNTTKAMLTLAGSPFTLLTGGFNLAGVSAEVAAANLEKFRKAADLILKTGMFVLIAALATLAYQSYKSVKAQDELTRALALNGASMGLTTQDALDLALSMEGAGVTTRNAATAMQAMAKEGGFTRSEITGVTKAAVDLYKYGGVAIEDTVKAYAKLKDDPVKGLIELAKATGNVNIKTLEQVDGLIKVGDKTTAVSEAFKAMQEANSKSVTRMQDELSALAKGLIWIGEVFAQTMDGMFSLLFNKTSPTTALAKRIVENQDQIDETEKFMGEDGFKNKTKEQQKFIQESLKARKTLVEGLTAQYKEMNKAAMGESAKQGEGVKLAGAFEKSTALRDEFLKTDRLALKKVETEKSYGLRITAEPDVAKRKALEKERDAVLAEIEKQRKSATKPEGKTEAQRQLERDQEVVRDLTNATKDLNAEYNNKEDSLKRQLTLGIANGGIDKAKYDLLQKELMEQQPALLKQKALEKKTTEEINKIQQDYLQTVQKIAEYNNETRDENTKLEYRLEVLGKTEEQIRAINQQRDKELKLAKAKDVYDKQLLENSKNPMTQFDTDVRAYQAYADRVRAINAETAVQAAEDFDREMKAISKSIADSIATALFEGGEAGSKQLKDTIVSKLREKITLSIDAFINPIINAGAQSIANSLGLGSGGSSSGSSSTIGVLGGIKSVSDAINGGFAAMGAATGQQFAQFATSSAGQAMGLSTQVAGPVSATGQGSMALTSTGAATQSMIATAATIAAQAIAGYGLYTGISGNKTINPTLDAIGKVASLFGPLYGVIGGLANRAFGMGSKEVRDAGIQGTLGVSSGAKLESFARWTKDSGWFNNGDEGVDVSALDKTITNPFNTAIVGISSQVKAFAGILGLSTQNIDNYTKQIKINLKDLSPEKQQEAIDKAIADFGVDLAGRLIGSSFIKENEDSLKALTRLATSLTTVNSVFDLLNVTLYEASLAGADASDRLLAAFGGVEKFTTSMQSYYEGYYSDAEKKANSLEAISKGLSSIGINKTNDEVMQLGLAGFRKLVEEAAKGRGTTTGDATFATIVGLANAFRPLIDSTEDVTKKFKDLGTSLDDEIQRIRGEILGTSPEAQANAQTAFTVATAQARAGDAEAAGKLPALSKALLDYAGNNATTLEELNQIRAATAASLTVTAAIVKSFGIAPVTTSSATSAVPSIINTTSPATAITGNYGDNSNTEVLIALEAVASMTNKNYKLLDGVINGENNLRVSVYAP